MMTRNAHALQFVKPTASPLPATLLLGGFVLAMAVSFWPGSGDALAGSGRTAKSVAWYNDHLAEASRVSRRCFAAETRAAMPETIDCQNALRALDFSHARHQPIH